MTAFVACVSQATSIEPAKIQLVDDMGINMTSGQVTYSITPVSIGGPVAAFIAYTLLRFGKTTHLIDGIAGLETVQSEIVGKQDLLIAVSYKPYAPETVQFAMRVAERKCKTIVITDSKLSPLAKVADLSLIVNEAEVSGFRSLASSATLAQALLLGYAFHRQKNGGGVGR